MHNLRPIKIVRIFIGMAAFSFGVAVCASAILLLGRENTDIDKPGLALIMAILFSISPFVYIIGFLWQEALVPSRARTQQVISAAACGIIYALILMIAGELDDSVQPGLGSLLGWLIRIVLITFWLLGPLFVAMMSASVESRVVRARGLEGNDAS
jgi:hypothetical protein